MPSHASVESAMPLTRPKLLFLRWSVPATRTGLREVVDFLADVVEPSISSLPRLSSSFSASESLDSRSWVVRQTVVKTIFYSRFSSQVFIKHVTHVALIKIGVAEAKLGVRHSSSNSVFVYCHRCHDFAVSNLLLFISSATEVLHLAVLRFLNQI